MGLMLSCESNIESNRMVGVGLNWRDLAFQLISPQFQTRGSGGVGMCWSVRHECCWLVGGSEMRQR